MGTDKLARYNTLEDGSTLVETDDGRQVRTALPAEVVAQNFGARHDPDLTLEQRQDARLQGQMSRLDDIRAANDPAYAAEREKRAKARAEEEKGAELDKKIEGLGREVEEQRAADYSGATALNDQQSHAAASDNPNRNVQDFANQTPGALGGLSPAARQFAADQGQPRAPDGAPLVPVSAPKPAPLQMQGQEALKQGGGQDPRLNAIGDLILQQAVKRTGPTKGGWVPRSQTREVQDATPPEALAAVDAASREEDTVLKSNAEKQAQDYRERVVAPQLDALDQDLGALSAQYERRKKYDAELQAKRKFADDTERAADTMARPDPRDDYFESHGGTFARFVAAIGLALGQAGAALTHSQNGAQQVLESAIKDHAQMLRDKYEQADRKGKNARNAYAQMLAQYGDPETAQQALELKGQAVADRMLKLSAQKHLSNQEQLQVDQQLAARKTARAQMWADAAAKAAGRTVSQTAYVPPSAGGTSVNASLLGKAADIYEKAGQAGKVDRAQLSNMRAQRETMVRLPPELAQKVGQETVFSRSKDSADELENTLTIASAYNNALEDWKRATHNGTKGAATMSADERALAEHAAVRMTDLAKPALGIKSITQYELPLLHEMSGHQASDLLSPKLMSQISKQVDATQRAMNVVVEEHLGRMTKSADKDDWAFTAKPVTEKSKKRIGEE